MRKSGVTPPWWEPSAHHTHYREQPLVYGYLQPCSNTSRRRRDATLRAGCWLARAPYVPSLGNTTRSLGTKTAYLVSLAAAMLRMRTGGRTDCGENVPWAHTALHSRSAAADLPRPCHSAWSWFRPLQTSLRCPPARLDTWQTGAATHSYRVMWHDAQTFNSRSEGSGFESRSGHPDFYSHGFHKSLQANAEMVPYYTSGKIPHPSLHGPRWCSGQTTRLPPRRTGFDSRRSGSQIFSRGNRAERCRWSAGFLGDLPFTPYLHSGAASHVDSPSSALKTSMLRAAKISALHFTWGNPSAAVTHDNTLYKDCTHSNALATSVLQLTAWSGAGMQGRGKRETHHKTRRPSASAGTIPAYENPGATPLVIDPGSPRLLANKMEWSLLRFPWVYAALREYCKSVESPAHSGDGDLVTRTSVTLIAPTLLGQKKKYRQAGRTLIDFTHGNCVNELGAGDTGDTRENPPTNSQPNPVTRPGTEPGLPWWEARVLNAQPPWPLERARAWRTPSYDQIYGSTCFRCASEKTSTRRHDSVLRFVALSRGDSAFIASVAYVAEKYCAGMCISRFKCNAIIIAAKFTFALSTLYSEQTELSCCESVVSVAAISSFTTHCIAEVTSIKERRLLSAVSWQTTLDSRGCKFSSCEWRNGGNSLPTWAGSACVYIRHVACLNTREGGVVGKIRALPRVRSRNDSALRITTWANFTPDRFKLRLPIGRSADCRDQHRDLPIDYPRNLE
ncbi:hypothetical protein PR048_017825 [Dryococelus australis]|uniref:Uncharacterized protein n=1 Tax=Dryococelus australis TaxID=614101 RepID=A0ABQ9HAP3_9NEOP|nr:hypothetical protein PR048_017825 [Dryococelus australis]